MGFWRRQGLTPMPSACPPDRAEFRRRLSLAPRAGDAPVYFKHVLNVDNEQWKNFSTLK